MNHITSGNHLLDFDNKKEMIPIKIYQQKQDGKINKQILLCLSR